MINIEVTKNSNENAASLLRRFTKRVRGSGILNRVRGIRYRKRAISKFTKKKQALKRIGKKAKYDELLKLGKIAEKPAFGTQKKGSK